MLREQSNCFAIARTLSPLRAITRISTACSWVNIDGAKKAVILAQVGHFYFGAVGQYYFGANTLAYCIRPETDSTYLEWLKTPSRRHGPASLAETLEKVRFLKAIGADTWDLSGVTLAKQQAYARQVQSRRPVKTREIKPSRHMIELVCFLRITLLELTDVALLQSSRRSQQLFREATDRAQASRAHATTGLLRKAAQASAILHDEAMTWQDRVLQARQLLAEFVGVTTGSFVSQVRKALAQDAQRVHACPGSVAARAAKRTESLVSSP